MSHTAVHRAPAERRSKSQIIRLALAALAILGIGTALTQAAWTDQVHFAADVSAGTFNLQGSIEGGPWLESVDPEAVELAVDLGLLVPNQDFEFEFEVRNAGTVTAHLTNPTLVGTTGDLIAAGCDIEADLALPTGYGTLAPDASTGAIVVTGTAGDWDDDCQGLSAEVVWVVTGSSDA